jgi:cytochrome b561
MTMSSPTPTTDAAQTVPIARKYSGTAMALHWLIALLIIGGFALGWVMTDIPGFTPAKLKYFAWHKWIGVTAMALIIIRLVWRATHTPPPLPATTGRTAAMAAHGVHHLLYLLMVCVPVSGYIYSSIAGIQVVYLGLVPLPTLVGPHPELRHLFRNIHVYLDWTLFAVVILHFLAVVKHQLLDRDRLLSRMLPFGD